jgi:hypothetical protein
MHLTQVTSAEFDPSSLYRALSPNPGLDQSMSIRTNRRLLCLVLAMFTIAAGLFWRLAPLGLPASLYKYGGSALWAAMVYWLVALVFPKLSPLKIAVLAALFAVAVELFRLYHAPALDSFRLTLAGHLLLGSFFSLRDIAAYWLAIAFTTIVDSNASHDQIV